MALIEGRAAQVENSEDALIQAGLEVAEGW
jgi:hypothetical protein